MTAYNPGPAFRLSSQFVSARTIGNVTRAHKGVDFSTERGTSIPAAGTGKVVYKKHEHDGYGHYVILEHRNPDGELIHTLYAHMREPSPLRIGQTVARGYPVGMVGSTGHSTGPHLHFEVHRYRSAGMALAEPKNEVDPLSFDVSGLQYPDTYSEPVAPFKPQSQLMASTICCLPITREDGSELNDAKSLATLIGKEANYLLGQHTWHGGIHISDNKAPWAKNVHPVRCMADGEVVAFRMMPDYLASQFCGDTHRYSNSFCLVRHRYSQKSKEGAEAQFVYYTLYMHLCPWKQWPTNSRFKLTKGWRVRHSVPTREYQPVSLVLPAGEVFELVNGVERELGYVEGQGEFEFAKIKIVSKGASSAHVLATTGSDSLWMAQDQNAIEPEANIVKPAWIYDQIEAVLKENMVGRADPQPRQGITGYPLAGDTSFGVSKGSTIHFNAHQVEWQEVNRQARRMARCIVSPSGKPVWLCVEETNIEIKQQEPTHIGYLYELPIPVPIRAGETIGYLGLYEAPESIKGGRSSRQLVHIELFSDDPSVMQLVQSTEWKEKGFSLIDGSESDGAVDPAKISPFFSSIFRQLTADKEESITPAKLESEIDSLDNFDKMKGMVVKHNSEWWVPTSKTMMERFKSIFADVSDLPPLIAHEVERVEQLGWMDKLKRVKISGPQVWHFYPLALLLSEGQSGRFIKNYTNYNYSLEEMIDIQMNLEQRGGPTIQIGSRFPRISRNEAAPYIDPRKHMSECDLYQYLDISKEVNVTIEQLDSYLSGRGILQGMGFAFCNAGRSYGINALYLAIHANLETERGTSQLSNGLRVEGETVYNMYGIGAVDGRAIDAGKQKAFELGWNTPEKAIDGGAQWIANKFIRSAQNTLYKMRWNPGNPGAHQYATAANWALVQAASLKKVFDQFPNIKIPLDIPVFR